MKEKLNQIRPRSNTDSTTKQKIQIIIYIFLLGITLGFLAKYLDNVPIIGEIGTLLGIWILIATLISVWSPSPETAALHVLIFFIAMLTAYYMYSMILFGFFPKRYFMAWGGFALISPLCAYIAWYASGNGWIAAFCASLPISLLLSEGSSFYYTQSAARAFDLFAVAALFVILANNINQRLRIFLFTLIVFYLFKKVWIISLIFGGV